MPVSSEKDIYGNTQWYDFDYVIRTGPHRYCVYQSDGEKL